MYCPFCNLKVAGQNYVFLSLKIAFILANCADPDEMQPYAAFHLSLHCLPKNLLTSIQNEKGSLNNEYRKNNKWLSR